MYFTIKTQVCYQSGEYDSNVSLINLIINPKPSNDDRKCKCTKIYLLTIDWPGSLIIIRN